MISDVEIFKQIAPRWIKNIIVQLTGNNFGTKLMLPIVDEIVENKIGSFVSLLADSEGNLHFDRLLDKYLKLIDETGGFKFKLGDLPNVPKGLANLISNKTYEIERSDLESLKTLFNNAKNEQVKTDQL